MTSAKQARSGEEPDKGVPTEAILGTTRAAIAATGQDRAS